MRTEVMIEANTSNASTYSSTDQFRLREAFIQAGNVLGVQPEAKFWAGERYYRRQHIEIDDFYLLDMSGYGGGVEDLNVKIGRAAISYLAGAQEGINVPQGVPTKSNIDMRLYDLKAPFGRFSFWYNYAVYKGGHATDGVYYPSSTGQAFGIALLRPELLGGYNKATIQYGDGAASDFNTSLLNPTDTKGSHTFPVSEHFLIQPNEHWSLMPVFVYQLYKHGTPGQGTDKWLSFGARPIYNFTNHLSLAFETGFDHTTSGQNLYEGWLFKNTLAFQIASGREFLSRPVLRLFFTYANWTNGFKGFVGGIPYQDQTSGISFGVQGESWW